MKYFIPIILTFMLAQAAFGTELLGACSSDTVDWKPWHNQFNQTLKRVLNYSFPTGMTTSIEIYVYKNQTIKYKLLSGNTLGYEIVEAWLDSLPKSILLFPQNSNKEMESFQITFKPGLMLEAQDEFEDIN